MYLAQNIKSDISDVCEDAIIFYNWLRVANETIVCNLNDCLLLGEIEELYG